MENKTDVNHYFFHEFEFGKALWNNDPAVKKLINIVLPDLTIHEDRIAAQKNFDEYAYKLNDAIQVFLQQKCHYNAAPSCIDNLLKQYGTPELLEQGENTVTFRQYCDLVIKNKDIILANINKS